MSRNINAMVFAACLGMVAAPALLMAAGDSATDPCAGGQLDEANPCPDQTDVPEYQGSGDDGAVNQDDQGADDASGDTMDSMPADEAPAEPPTDMPVAQ
ncbi:MAG: hypothetical protein COS82_04280 [Zetaproteobacteria bacterium CG06_land_8_20_14_3_00_59_53]|nr:MAG: hypothetical protein AUK36_09630 [Zetaproteobacteria bacterium CG2_30_59_37]PIO88853.1 MAG: hypothetical protein COX56_10385 [Zetaproteobacteria bacterium CG23_combo_of_CG06-09_8_20_14_all_59_86]PIQ65157.1 MAG: hypothetical protein COV97_04970 [Zetaproteobacteria bacterium CG11_big_fil_rev_8_21_14_0_20_59_439]PIU70736.1 MAG: hypothetical protein COS82_04280 [Zetaproteobacteria bacterium CG06_land_8_20_14_3_00_59_53]PIU96406.1 MAG: hypothetical protein COS62_08615 [Zetaproteobacteria bac